MTENWRSCCIASETCLSINSVQSLCQVLAASLVPYIDFKNSPQWPSSFSPSGSVTSIGFKPRLVPSGTSPAPGRRITKDVEQVSSQFLVVGDLADGIRRWPIRGCYIRDSLFPSHFPFWCCTNSSWPCFATAKTSPNHHQSDLAFHRCCLPSAPAPLTSMHWGALSEPR